MRKEPATPSRQNMQHTCGTRKWSCELDRTDLPTRLDVNAWTTGWWACKRKVKPAIMLAKLESGARDGGSYVTYAVILVRSEATRLEQITEQNIQGSIDQSMNKKITALPVSSAEAAVQH